MDNIPFKPPNIITDITKIKVRFLILSTRQTLINLAQSESLSFKYNSINILSPIFKSKSYMEHSITSRSIVIISPLYFPSIIFTFNISFFKISCISLTSSISPTTF